jgi:hypothetical protein
MTSIKQATENAIAFARMNLGEGRTSGIRLEEVTSTNSNSTEAWLVTLSMINRDRSPMAVAIGGRDPREYKTFTVRKSDGEVIAMKIRELADA